MTLQGINDARHWRDRAAEMRVLSDEFKDPEAQRMMLTLARLAASTDTTDETGPVRGSGTVSGRRRTLADQGAQ